MFIWMLVFWLSGASAAPSLDCALACASSLELPRATNGLPRDWLPDGDDGTVHITFRIGAAGNIDQLRLVGSTAHLRDFTEGWVRRSTFSPTCNGQTVSLTYVYRIYPTPASLHLPAVTLKQGAVFLLEFEESRPPAPTRIIPINPKTGVRAK